MKGRIFVALLTVLALNFAMIPSADAVPRAYVCTVSGVEIDLDGYVRISLTYEAAVGPRTRTHLAPTGHEKAMMAVALTAIASGLQVEAFVDFWVHDSTIAYLKVVN